MITQVFENAQITVRIIKIHELKILSVDDTVRMRDEATGQFRLQKNHRSVLDDHLDHSAVMVLMTIDVGVAVSMMMVSLMMVSMMMVLMMMVLMIITALVFALEEMIELIPNISFT